MYTTQSAHETASKRQDNLNCQVLLQVDKNVEREILNHRMLINPNVVGFKEVSSPGSTRVPCAHPAAHAVACVVAVVALVLLFLKCWRSVSLNQGGPAASSFSRVHKTNLQMNMTPQNSSYMSAHGSDKGLAVAGADPAGLAILNPCLLVACRSS